MTFGIVIGTKADGTKVAVGDPLPLSKAKAVYSLAEGADLKTIELFELRTHSKRRKVSTAAVPSEAPKAPKVKRAQKKETQPKETK